jgi:large subunit ribosomal protein L19
MRDFLSEDNGYYILMYIYMSNYELVSKIQWEYMKQEVPNLRTGMEIEVYQNISEWNKTRIQRFKGIIIKTAGKTPLEKTITVRRKIWAFWVERIFTIHSPTIQEIKVLRQFKVRRKYIWFIRGLTGKAARLKEIKK